MATSNDNLLKQWIEAENSHDVEKVLTLLTDDIVIEGLPATGKRFSIKTCSFGEFENGKIKGRRDYWDLVTLREQLLGKQDNS